MIVERILLSLDFESTFISIPLDISNIEAEKDLDIDKLKNFNINI